MHNNSFSEHHSGPRFRFVGIFSPRFGIIRIIGFTIGGIVLAGLFALLFGWLVQLLWNWLMPALFSVKAITYWQAFGVGVLTKILFGGFSIHHDGHRFGRHYYKQRGNGGDWSGDDTWKPRGSYKNWKYYDKYWHDEGKAAFEAYIDKIEKEEKP